MPKKAHFDAPHRMRELREKRNLSLEALAELMGNVVTVNQLSRLERGLNQMTQHRLDQVATALGVKPADILAAEDGGLTEKERELIETYREIPESLRASFDALREANQRFRGSPEVIELGHRDAG